MLVTFAPLRSPPLLRRLWSIVPSGGVLPPDVWRRRLGFLVGLTWFHAVVIALAGPVLGYRWAISLDALVEHGTVLSSLRSSPTRGHTVDSATNGVEALQKFLAGWFDLVVTDRAMLDQLRHAVAQATGGSLVEQ